jgi:hypothetical protein
MPRGIAWDALPNKFEPSTSEKVPLKDVEIQPHEFNFIVDASDIGRRILFGCVVRCFNMLKVFNNETNSILLLKSVDQSQVQQLALLKFFGTQKQWRET